MELSHLIKALADPTAYPFPVQAVEVRQTHISAVFLAGSFVYKVKKPIAPGFLDFTTLEKRQHFCYEEVQLNRRLAPDVYLGVVPVVQTPTGVRLEGEGEVVEWAVKMRRLPGEATLLEHLRRGEVTVTLVEMLARQIATFHLGLEPNDRIASFGRFDAVARNIRDVFEQADPLAGAEEFSEIFNRTRQLMGNTLERFRPLIDSRAARGVPRECHGDLHLDHIYYFPDQPPPSNLVIIDCIEFSERLRFIDPVADIAFTAMDLTFHDRPDLAGAFANTYFQATRDEEGRTLIPLYTAYRSSVRGLVESMLTADHDVPEAERNAARQRARKYWLLARAELESVTDPGDAR
ncbi:phosphotransferase [Fimbriiglobus ruber]|uniref:Aminoglycoside phosphotransferase domain-containing protein n=1 Tax=Fimbriiglobus ruber TaxID=1908690 RepID=A0A225DQ52_9BACT|nr:phosphotransferase [Fimbriiglobus ruber]OWK43243.1 hypothetical protein FRUB_02842 [Fimbriiglobus ruber]